MDDPVGQRIWCRLQSDATADARSNRGTSTGVTAHRSFRLPDQSRSIPSWVAAHTERVEAVKGDPARLQTLLAESDIPMVLLDDERRCIDANPAALAEIGLSLEGLRRMRLDDFTPPYLRESLESGWSELLRGSWVLGHEAASPEGTSYFGLTSFGTAHVLPGRHLLAFLPGAPADEPPSQDGHRPADAPGPLTRRELEVLQLAATGLKGPAIARELVLTPATIRTHFANIYRKLDVGDRAAAVAKAMRLGLIR
jgi:DNA-binding CsgD family transcriptional regulator